MADDAIKVVIVGGGCAGLATAWELSRPNAQRTAPDGVTYDITVYEQSWRLGGKGASSRDAHGRILEHGLHVWLGFYENAFRMMRECYAEVGAAGWGPSAEPGRRLAHGVFEDAFIPEPHLGVAVERKTGALQVWSGYFPPMPGQPGDLLDLDTNPFTLRGYLARALGLARALLQSVLAPAGGPAPPGEPRPDGRSAFDEAMELDFDFDSLGSPRVLVDHVAGLLRLGALTTAAGLLQAVTMLESWIRERSPVAIRPFRVVQFVEAVATQTRRQLRDLVEIDEETRRKTEIIDLLMTITVGLYRDRVLFSERGLDAINGIDYRDWLLKHGATHGAVNSAFVTGIYDLVFAYRDGDRRRPALAAGQALRGALRMFFTYRGAMFWRLGSGMGDAVFAPLYRVLAQRGVKFKLQHELTEITFSTPADDPAQERSRRVAELVFSAPQPGHEIAEPLDPFGCWPTAPTAPPTERRVLRQAVDDGADGDTFDVVVFATGVDVVSRLCRETLCRDVTAWREMSEQVRTVATVSAQVWLDQDLAQLGWERGPAIVAGLAGRFNTWADMSRTLASERAHRRHADAAGADSTARSVAYFCGVLPDDPPGTPVRDVRGDLQELLASGMRPLWPAAYVGGRTAADHAVARDGTAAGRAYLADQHVSINHQGSDRYTLSLPGSLDYRISPLDTTVANMTIAGDWTECGFNAGCVEAAVMSGKLAAHAISGHPALKTIIGYHHP